MRGLFLLKQYIGIDIGGTKIAVLLGSVSEKEEIKVLEKERLSTSKDCLQPNLDRITQAIDSLLLKKDLKPSQVSGIGISCGGPLDVAKGIIQSPPNLPLWKDVAICQILEQRFGIPARLQNDANACALAEWKFGAGRGTRNMMFITFGTGFGAGLILDGRLYSGTNGNAGEIGHIRLADYGPSGYGKVGSYEGFCSGAGIAQIGQTLVREALQNGQPVSFCPNEMAVPQLDAKVIGDAADAGDILAQKIYQVSGHYLGIGLAIMIDTLNPEAIVIGSIFARSQQWLWPSAKEVIEREALPGARKVCNVLPAALGESIGDIAAIAVAYSGTEQAV